MTELSKRYKINHFYLSESDGLARANLFLENRALKISDQAIVNCLNEMSRIEGIIGQDALEVLVGAFVTEVEEAINFFQFRAGIISECRDRPTVSVFSNDSEIASALACQILSSDNISCTVESSVGLCKSDINLIVQLPFDRAISSAYLETSRRSPHLVFCHSYFIYRHFIIEPLYCGSAGTPCHNCCFSLGDGNRRPPGHLPVTWTDLFQTDSFVGNSKYKFPTLPMTSSERGAGVFYLSRLLRPLWSLCAGQFFHENSRQIAEMDFGSGEIRRSDVVHSEFCSCLRGSA